MKLAMRKLLDYLPIPAPSAIDRQDTAETKVVSKRIMPPPKQAELERLCTKLLEHEELLTSGRLQLLGLLEIRKRLGKHWEKLSAVVYETVESVLKQLTGPSDIFVRYRDDTYIVVYATASYEEAEQTTAMIADEIRKRLFELDDKQLRKIELTNAIDILSTEKFIEYGFSDFLDKYAFESDHLPSLIYLEDVPATDPPATPSGIEVNATDYRHENRLQIEKLPLELSYAYQPLWDVHRNNLAIYLCQPFDTLMKQPLHAAYREIAQQGLSRCVSLDIQVLEGILGELETLKTDGRNALITCPVQYDTLHAFEGYELYKKKVMEIPLRQRQQIIFHVVGPKWKLPEKDIYWFAKPLRQFCRHIFTELPLRDDINFRHLKNVGVECIGVRLENTWKDESDVFQKLRMFGTRTKMVGIPFVFALDVRTLSLATMAVCSGFNIVGGPIISPNKKKPGKIRKFSYASLIKPLLPPEEETPQYPHN